MTAEINVYHIPVYHNKVLKKPSERWAGQNLTLSWIMWLSWCIESFYNSICNCVWTWTLSNVNIFIPIKWNIEKAICLSWWTFVLHNITIISYYLNYKRRESIEPRSPIPTRFNCYNNCVSFLNSYYVYYKNVFARRDSFLYLTPTRRMLVCYSVPKSSKCR